MVHNKYYDTIDETHILYTKEEYTLANRIMKE